mmetsp:Transcript_13378/g.22774  ORF Transcript_13378/g.22774 Transcript_13378/m.22774 type:complete len:203 (-) Transcript_13378:82-690(-)
MSMIQNFDLMGVLSHLAPSTGHLAVKEAINDYKNLGEVYDFFTTTQIVQLLAVAAVGVLYSGELDSVYVVIGFVLNGLDWVSFEYLRGEGNLVLEGESSLVEFVRNKTYMEVVFYIFPICFVLGVVWVIPSVISRELYVLLTALIFMVGIEVYYYYMYTAGINELLDDLGYSARSDDDDEAKKDDKGWYRTTQEGDKYYIFN